MIQRAFNLPTDFARIPAPCPAETDSRIRPGTPPRPWGKLPACRSLTERRGRAVAVLDLQVAFSRIQPPGFFRRCAVNQTEESARPAFRPRNCQPVKLDIGSRQSISNALIRRSLICFEQSRWAVHRCLSCRSIVRSILILLKPVHQLPECLRLVLLKTLFIDVHKIEIAVRLHPVHILAPLPQTLRPSPP